MKTHRDCKGRRCKNFDWRTNDSTWQAERANDKIVFRKILVLVRKHGWHPRKAILLMLRNEFRAERMKGKRPKSWKDKYNLWRSRITLKVIRCASGKICV